MKERLGPFWFDRVLREWIINCSEVGVGLSWTLLYLSHHTLPGGWPTWRASEYFLVHWISQWEIRVGGDWGESLWSWVLYLPISETPGIPPLQTHFITLYSYLIRVPFSGSTHTPTSQPVNPEDHKGFLQLLILFFSSFSKWTCFKPYVWKYSLLLNSSQFCYLSKPFVSWVTS